MPYKHIKWFTKPQPATDVEINSVETSLGLKFPDDYRNFARANSGGEPMQTDFTFPDADGIFHAGIGKFLTFNNDDNYGILNTLKTVEFFPKSLVPVAVSGGGDYVCFNFEKPGIPSVVFWHHGRRGNSNEISLIAETFDEFIEMLREPDVDEDE